MRKPIVYFITSLLCIHAYTQENIQHDKWILKFAPLALFDPATASIQPGIEYKFSRRWSLEVDYGIRFRGLEIGTKNENFIHYRYNKLRLEGRWYFASGDKYSSSPFFVAAEGFFIHQQYGKAKSYYTTTHDSLMYAFDSAGIRRSISGLCFKVGALTHFKRNSRFFIEWSLGLGVRSTNVDYKKVINERPAGVRYPREFDVLTGDDFKGTESTIHLAANLKLAYRLW